MFRFEQNYVQNPWIIKGILKSSKTKQKLYDKLLK